MWSPTPNQKTYKNVIIKLLQRRNETVANDGSYGKERIITKFEYLIGF